MKWDEFIINGTVPENYAKLRKLALRYNPETLAEINQRIQALHLPENYTSIQISSGDKILEVKELITPTQVLERIDKIKLPIKNLFIFTDDFRNVEQLRKARPQWNIYSLCRENIKRLLINQTCILATLAHA